jgi:D-arabinose 1-dehydrogenase-like Zn-dependent alcohol dehydrogenase
MKAAVPYRFGQNPRIAEFPIPQVGLRDTLVQVIGAGICHPDLGIIDGHVPIGKLPMITMGCYFYHAVTCVCSRVDLSQFIRRRPRGI